MGGLRPARFHMMKLRYDGKLVILTCFYEHRAYSPYVESLARTIGVLDKLGIAWDYWPSHGTFYLEHSINGSLTKIMNDPEITDVLIIDSDESWEPESVVRILMHEDEVVGGSYRKKNSWESYIANLVPSDDENPVGKMLPDGTALLKAEGMASGFMRLQTSVLRKFHEAYPEARRNEVDGTLSTEFLDKWRYGNVVFSHDLGFCKRLSDIGIDLWIDPMIKIDHWGITRYPGDFDKYLREQLAFAEVAKLAKEASERT